MAIPVLRTKLFIPPIRDGLIARARLVERLNAGIRAGCRLTVVSAPAGFGKTTLLSEWVHSRERSTICPHVCWVSLDGGDNDLLRFWTYVLAAVRTVPAWHGAGVGESGFSMLQSPQSPPIETVLVDLINDIMEHAPSLRVSGEGAKPNLECGLLLVLDDYHTITSPEVSASVAFLVDHMPPLLHVAVSTRSDPALPLSRLRGRRQLAELGAADLRFESGEVTALLNQVMSLSLSKGDIAALESRTEGWVVGLQMAARALQSMQQEEGGNATSVASFISAFTGSHRYVLDYLTDEVLLKESESVQRFLLQTSILGRLSGPLCDAVTGGDNGQNMLERLDAANLFIVPLDEDRHWYRYHHLFADLLSKRLRRTNARLVPELHRRASEWYERAGSIEDAIDHALEGVDYTRAARLVEQHAVEQMMASRKEAALAAWLEALPDQVVKARPWLCVYLGWTRYWMGMREEVEECLQDAERALSPAPPLPERGQHVSEGTARTEEQLVAGYVAAIRAHHALTNEEIPRVIEMAQRAIAFLPEGDYMRCEAAVALGGAYLSQGNVAATEEAFAQARATALASGYPPLAVPSACYVGMQQAKQGRLREAHATYTEALGWAESLGGRLLPVAGFPLVKLGDLSREWNDLEAAERELAQGLELCVQLGQADVLAEAYVSRARLQLARGDLPRVLGTLAQVDQITQRVKVDPWITSWADDCRLRLWLATGNLAAVTRWMETGGLSVDDELDYHRDLHHTNLARALIGLGMESARGNGPAEVAPLLDRLLAAAQKAGWVDKEIQVYVLQALVLRKCGNEAKAAGALERALVLAQRGGYVQTFVSEGAPIVPLLRLVVECDSVRGYVSQLLDILGDCASPGGVATDLEGLSSIERLSEREIEVLELVAQGLTNREIGERLFITQGTVKAHTANIYGKLSVRSRIQAVARARALGIL